MKLAFYMCLAMLPSSVTGTAVSTEMFPALRKKMQKQKFLVAAQTQTSKSKVPDTEEEKESQEVPGVIPAPLDAGPDGFPQLPAVSQMLSEASGTLKKVNSRTSSLEARVVQAQMQSESKMAKQKAAFEEKLKEQEESNQAVITANGNISAQIKSLQGSNAALKKHAHEIEETNKVMRSELRTLESRLGAAKDFTAKSLTSTDDSKNSLLQVLKGGHKHHRALVETSSSTHREVGNDDDDSSDDSDDSEDDRDSKDDDEEDEQGTSLLLLSSKVQRTSTVSSADSAASFEAAMSDLESAVPAGPGMPLDPTANVPAESPSDLLSVLSKDVAHLAQQEKDSEKNLKNMFIKDFRAGAKRHQALLAQQKSLMGTRGNLLAVQAKLKSAEAHLEATKTQLEGRLHGLGQYLQKLAHLAMAPQREVPHLLEVLPKSVALKVV